MFNILRAIKTMRILVVDAHPDSSQLIAKSLTQDGFDRVVVCDRAEKALVELSSALARRQTFDLVCLSIDLPDAIGLTHFDEINNVFDLSVLLVTEPQNGSLAMEGLGRGAGDFVTRPLNPVLFMLKAERLLTQRFLQNELRRSTARNETLFLNVLSVMAKVQEARDPYTRSHSENVSSLSLAIAREMSFPDDEVRRIGVAGILHDLGKMGIKEAILKKPGPLEPAEMEVIKKHPVIASTILDPIEQLRGALGYIKHHHEHYDGKGYPDGLSGENIPWGARIIHVAEAFDSMTSKRAYSDAKPVHEALLEIHQLAGKQFDPQCTEALAVILKKREETQVIGKQASGRSLPQVLEDLTARVSVDSDSKKLRPADPPSSHMNLRPLRNDKPPQ